MPRQFKAQTNFSSGELDPAMRLRIDTGAFQNGVETLTNVQLLNTGGGRRRDGTFYRNTLLGEARLRQFEFDSDENYVFAFTNGQVQIFNESGTLLTTLAGPWNDTTKWQMTFAQLGDVLLVFHQGFAPRKISRTSLTTFAIATVTFARSLDGTQEQQPFYKLVDDSFTMAASNESGTVTLACSAAFFSAARVGTYIRIHETPILITGVTSSTVATGVVEGVIKPRLGDDPFKTIKNNGQIDVTIPLHGLNPGQNIVFSGANDIAGITAAQINTTFTPRGAGAPAVGKWYIRDQNTIRIYTAGTATSGANGGGSSVQYVIDNTFTRAWDEQVFNAINGWPACGTFHQQRLYMAGTPEIPSGLWGSRIGEFFNFGLGTAEDRDGIFINVGQENGVSVRHLVSGKHLQIFTEVGEFYVPRQDGQPVTPLTITVDKQTPYGSLDVQPVSLDGATIFLQKSKTAVREFIYSEAERSYNANPLSLAASHMLKTPRDMAVLYGTSTRPEQYAFLVNTDGSMAVFYSARVERLAGWARWTMGSGAKFISAAAVNGKLFACVLRFGSYTLEEVASATELTIDGAQDFTNASAQSVWSVGTRYANRTVRVLARDDDGGITWSVGTYVVAGDGTLTLTSAHKKIIVGYDFDFVIKTLTPVLESQSGTLLGEIKRIAQVQVGLYSSLAVDVQGQALILRQVTDDFSLPPARFTGYQRFSILGYDEEPSITITQTDPLPLTILGLVMKVST